MNELIKSLLKNKSPVQVYNTVLTDYMEIFQQSLSNDAFFYSITSLILSICIICCIYGLVKTFQHEAAPIFLIGLMISTLLTIFSLCNLVSTVFSPNDNLMNRIQHEYRQSQKEKFTAETGISL